MKVLLVAMSLDPQRGGGVAVRTRHLARALAAAGAQCTILTSREGASWEGLEGCRVEELPVVGGRFRLPVGGFGRLRRAVGGADVVLLGNHWTAVNLLAWRAARRGGRPHVVSPAGALRLSGRSRRAKRLYDRCGGGALVREAAGWVAVAPNELDDFAARGIDVARVRLIPNGMPEEGPLPRSAGDGFRRSHGLGDDPLLLFLGRLAPIKGPDLLLDALAATPAMAGWRLALAGADFGLEPELRRQTSRLGLEERVRFVGFLDGTAKREALAAASLLVIPSRREAMSLVVLEAAAAARPVVLTDACGFPQVARAGGGWVVPATVEGLAGGLSRAAAEAGSLTARGEALRRYAMARYSWRRIAELHLELFAEILAAQRSAA